MKNNWPLIASALMIVIAVGLGLWKREAIEESAERHAMAAQSQARAQATQMLQAERNDSKTVSAPTQGAPVAAPVAAPAPAPALTPAPSPAAGAPTTSVSPTVTNAAVPPPAKPAAPPGPKFSLPSAPPAPATPAQPAKAQPPAPADAAANPLNSLRDRLEKELAMQASQLVAGGYAFQLDGARIEVQGMPAWSITVYNINTQQPEIETDNFKRLYAAAAVELGFDPNLQGVTLASGKTSLQTASKLGNLTVVRDPVKGNSATIQPNQRRAPKPAPGALGGGLATPPATAGAAPANPPTPAPAAAPTTASRAVTTPVAPAPVAPAPAPAATAPAPAPQNWVNAPAPATDKK